MTYGEQSFLEGVGSILDQIVKDASGIAQLRTEAATMKAKGDIGLASQKFLAWVDSPEFRPEDFDSKFKDFQAGLDDYATNLDIAPARDAVKALGSSLLPTIYAQGAAAMNKAMLNKAAGDYMSSLDTASQIADPDARWTTLQGLLDKAPLFMDQTKIVEFRSSAYRNYRVDKTEEAVRASGNLQAGITNLYSADWRKANGMGNLGQAEVASVGARLTAELTAKTTDFLSNFSQVLDKSVDQFIDVKSIEATARAANISDAGIEKTITAAQAHNDDTLVSTYLQRINNTTTVDQITRLQKDLQVEGEWTGEQWVGSAMEEKRNQLLNMLAGKLASANAPAKTGTLPADVASVSDTLQRNLAILGATGSVSFPDPATGKMTTLTAATKDDFNRIVNGYAFTRMKSQDGNVYMVFPEAKDIETAIGYWKRDSKDDAFDYVAGQAKLMAESSDSKGNAVKAAGKYPQANLNTAIYALQQWRGTSEGMKASAADLQDKFNSLLITPIVVDSLNGIKVGAKTGFFGLGDDQKNLDAAEHWTQLMQSGVLQIFGGDIGRYEDYLKRMGVDTKGGIRPIIDELSKQFETAANAELPKGLGAIVSAVDPTTSRLIYTVPTPNYKGIQGQEPSTVYTVYTFTPEEVKIYGKDHPSITPNQEWWMKRVMDTSGTYSCIPYKRVGDKK